MTKIQVINILKLMIPCKFVNMTRSLRTLNFSEQKLTKCAQNATFIRTWNAKPRPRNYYI